MNGLNGPRGSNILAETFNSDHLLVGSNFACFAVFQIEPRTLTATLSAVLLALMEGPVVAFAYDSSYSEMNFSPSVVTAGSTRSTDRLNASCTVLEFVLHFRNLNPPCCIIDLDFSQGSKAFWNFQFSVFSSYKIIDIKRILEKLNEIWLKFFRYVCV